MNSLAKMQIEHLVLFAEHQMYHSLVYLCNDPEISSYISLCIASLRDLFIHQLVDMISINIHNNQSKLSPILRRYLIEFHSIDDPCLRAVYDNTKQLIHHLDQTFAQCIKSIQQIPPTSNSSENYSKKWTFQMRFSLHDILKRRFEMDFLSN